MSRILVAMSGGVDSSVAAAVLASEGHDVVGVTMKLWGGPSDTGCCSVSDVDDARRVAQQLDIDHHVFNFGVEFDRHVVAPYVADHAAGRTPNPCVECNRHLKFDRLLRRADALGFDAVATGHHARRVDRADGAGGVGIARGADRGKDQSYVLYPLHGEALARTLFPLGHLTKDEVRSLAAELGLRTAAKPDSQDVCFITREKGGRGTFLGDRIPLRRGAIVDREGAVLGSVDAVELVTVGQRRGLDIGGPGGPHYVVDVDVPGATVVVGSAEDLLADEVRLESMVWAGAPWSGPTLAQCSAHGRTQTAVVEAIGPDRVLLRWDEPQRRVAVGQSVVLYDGDVVVGGGIATGANGPPW